MIKRFVSIVGTVLLYAAVATMLAEVTAVAGLYFKGSLDKSRLYRVLAALHGIDVITLQSQLAAQEQVEREEQPSFESLLEARELKSLDLDLRESALTQGLGALHNLQVSLETEQTRFQNVKKSYDTRLKQLATDEQASSIQELQRTLEALKPKQAKEQIVKIIDDDAMADVVAMLKRMSLDKRKKILAEFKDGADADTLSEILSNIRKGEPLASQIKETRDQLQQFSTGPTSPSK